MLKAAQGRDPVTGLPLNVGGSKTPFGSSARMTTGRELGVIGRDVANLNPLVRTGLKIRDKGKFQGDDLTTITHNLSANDAKKSKDRADAQGSTRETILDSVIPFRKKTDLGAESTYRHAISEEIKKVAERKAKLTKGSPAYEKLTAKQTELKRKIGAVPAKKIKNPYSSPGGVEKWDTGSGGVEKWDG
jgi:hypothetical protein